MSGQNAYKSVSKYMELAFYAHQWSGGRGHRPADGSGREILPIPDIVREIILAGLKAGQENSGRMDLKLMNTSLKEMRFTAKVFGPYREVRKVTVFGSARTRPDACPCTRWQPTWGKSWPMPDSW